MTVSELIEKLQQLDGELTVVLDGYEGGYEDAREIGTVQLVRDVNKSQWFYGSHARVFDDDDCPSTPHVWIGP